VLADLVRERSEPSARHLVDALDVVDRDQQPLAAHQLDHEVAQLADQAAAIGRRLVGLLGRADERRDDRAEHVGLQAA
jgi:hypothetical protein